MYTGLTGKVTISTEGKTDAKVAYISNWSIDLSSDVIEVTQLGQSYKEKAATIRDWSASADGTVCFDGADSHKYLFDAMAKGKEVDIKFYLYCEKTPKDNDRGPSKKDTYFKGKGFIESLSVDLSAEDKGNISISIAGNKELELCCE